MTIQVMFNNHKAIFVEFSPVNRFSPIEFVEMREMLKEAEALGVIRDFAMY
jgi:hypothetical protein